jgi:hypothetical protein
MPRVPRGPCGVRDLLTFVGSGLLLGTLGTLGSLWPYSTRMRAWRLAPICHRAAAPTVGVVDEARG